VYELLTNLTTLALINNPNLLSGYSNLVTLSSLTSLTIDKRYSDVFDVPLNYSNQLGFQCILSYVRVKEKLVGSTLMLGSGDGSTGTVSVVIPMFKAASEYLSSRKRAGASAAAAVAGEQLSSSKLPIATDALSVGCIVKAIVDTNSEIYHFCYISRGFAGTYNVISMHNGKTYEYISADKVRCLELVDVQLDLRDLNALLSAYSSNMKGWKHSIYYPPGSDSSTYGLFLQGYEKLGLYLGIDGVDENGRVTSLLLDDSDLLSGVLPSPLLELSHLSKLSVVGCKLTSIPEEIERLTNLTELNLGSNMFTTIPLSIALLSNLTKLSLASCGLTSITEEIGKLVNLTELNLDSNKSLVVLPDSISNLTNLSALYLNGNNFTEFPASLVSLSAKLSFLTLSCNKLSALPYAVTALSNLHTLYLDSNQFSVVPECMSC